MSETIIIYKNGKKEKLNHSEKPLIFNSGNFVVIDFLKDVDGQDEKYKRRFIPMERIKEILEVFDDE